MQNPARYAVSHLLGRDHSNEWDVDVSMSCSCVSLRNSKFPCILKLALPFWKACDYIGLGCGGIEWGRGCGSGVWDRVGVVGQWGDAFPVAAFGSNATLGQHDVGLFDKWPKSPDWFRSPQPLGTLAALGNHYAPLGTPTSPQEPIDPS